MCFLIKQDSVFFRFSTHSSGVIFLFFPFNHLQSSTFLILFTPVLFIPLMSIPGLPLKFCIGSSASRLFNPSTWHQNLRGTCCFLEYNRIICWIFLYSLDKIPTPNNKIHSFQMEIELCAVSDTFISCIVLTKFFKLFSRPGTGQDS